MQVSMTLPTGRVERPAEFLTADAVAEIAAAAELAGFDSLSVSEHPFPDDDWLAAAGHHDLEPLVALAFAAAATTTIGLRTSLLVLPYRNPFLTARGVASLDALSGGRVILGVGAGYLEPEFRALGVAFEERNELTDEAIVAMRRAWAESGVRMTGRHFDAQGHTMLPRPSRPGGPPIWVGGNSKRAIRRAVELGDGWMPMPYTAHTVSRRTARLESLNDLQDGIAYAAAHAERVGRTEPLGLSFGLQSVSLPESAGAAQGDDAQVAAAEVLAGLGVTDTGATPSGDTRAAFIASIEQLGAELLPRLHAVPVHGIPTPATLGQTS
jgi:probable F420-dependent oxidoreductase